MMRPLDRIKVNAFFEHLPQRTHVTQFIDRVGYLLDRVIYLLFGGIASESEAKRAVCQVVAESQCL